MLYYLEESMVPMRTTLPSKLLGVYEDLLGTLHGLERPSRSLGVRRFFDDLLPDGRKVLGGDNCRVVFVALDLALVGTLEGGADGDDLAWTWHL